MIKILSLFLFVFLLKPNVKESAKVREQIDAAITNYTSQINNLLSQNETSIALSEVYFATLSNDITYDVDLSNDLQEVGLVKNLDSKIGLINYVTILGEDYRAKIKGEFIDKSIQIDDCYLNYSGAKTYLVSIKKELSYKKITREFNFIIGVSLETQYPIRFVLFEEVAKVDSKIAKTKTCFKSSRQQEIIEVKQRQFKLLKNKADNFYKNKDYYNARETYKKALLLDNSDLDLVDGIRNSNYFITKNLKQVIENLIANSQFKKALVELNSYANNTSHKNQWYLEKSKFCEEKLEIANDNYQLNRANILLKNYQSKKALVIYNTLLDSKHLDIKYIKNQIIKCKESDPNYVRNALTKAYNAAVKSKKNYLETFKTYSKFQNSGLLTGEQYYFMCLMMINKHTTIAKPMGFSRNQARLLSRSYFYKAKNLGINVSYLETQIFTKNIEIKKR